MLLPHSGRCSARHRQLLPPHERAMATAATGDGNGSNRRWEQLQQEVATAATGGGNGGNMKWQRHQQPGGGNGVRGRCNRNSDRCNKSGRCNRTEADATGTVAGVTAAVPARWAFITNYFHQT